MSRYLYSDNKTCYGEMGSSTSLLSVKVGDLVAFNYNGRCMSGIVAEDYNNENIFYIMGLWGEDIRALNVRVVLKHDLVTDDVTQRLHGLYIKERVRMTISEIEKALGYPIEIVEDLE